MKPNIKIDEKAIEVIREKALAGYRIQRTPSQVNLIIEALESYIRSKGGEPGFTIETKEK